MCEQSRPPFPLLMTHLSTYKTLFLMLLILYLVLYCFPKCLECRAGTTICNSTNLVSHDRFFILNYNNKITCPTKYFAGSADFVIKAFDCTWERLAHSYASMDGSDLQTKCLNWRNTTLRTVKEI